MAASSCIKPSVGQLTLLQDVQQELPLWGTQAGRDDSQLKVLEDREAMMQVLRREQESHHHKQIWTKDAHGGPYHKVISKVDVQGKNLERALILGNTTALPTHPEDLLGYERVETGPTTNFVGNHMTRGAVDLIQAELSGMADRDRTAFDSESTADKKRAQGSGRPCLLPRRERAAGSYHSLLPCNHSPSADLALRAPNLSDGPQGAPDMASLRMAARQLLAARDRRLPGTAPVLLA